MCQVMTVSVHHRQVLATLIATVAIEMMGLNQVTQHKVESTVETLASLLFQEKDFEWSKVRIALPSSSPIQPVSIIRRALSPDLDMSADRHGAMTVKRLPLFCLKYPSSALPD